MRRRFKVVLNIEMSDPEKPYPSGGDYAQLNRIDGLIHKLLYNVYWPTTEIASITLDKIIDKGEI